MKLGADRQKTMILGGLVAIAAVVFYFNVLSDDTPPSTGSPTAGLVRPNIAPVAPATVNRKSDALRQQREFRPKIARSPEERTDPATIDPTLRLETLAKLQTVTMTGAGRNLFEFGAAPPPAAPKLDPAKPEPKIIPKRRMGPELPPPPPAPVAKVEPPKPQAPPIPLKFYGYVSGTKGGVAKRGFFLDGEEIQIAREGDVIKSRYKVIRFGLSSVEMEDTQFSQRQTLRLEEAPNT